MANPLEKTRSLVDEHVVVTRDVQHAMIGGDNKSVASPQLRHQVLQGRVGCLERRRPLPRLPALGVRRNVEFGNVQVGDTRPTRPKPFGCAGRPIVNCRPTEVGRTPQGRPAKAGVAVTFGTDRHRGLARAVGLLEQGRHTLPRRRVLMVVPARQLVDHTIPRGVVGGIAHDSVATRQHSRGQRGDPGRGRRGKSGLDDRASRHRAGESSRVSAAGAQCIHTQPVDQHHYGMIDGSQTQTVGFGPHGGDRTFQHVGKAHRVGFGRR